jgi:hypothetical protein
MTTRSACALILLFAVICLAVPPTKKKKRAAAAPVTPAMRQAARTEIEAKIAAVKTGIENPGALTSFFASLQAGDPVHILQFGDSHTASDDWANAIRIAAQAKYGDGGPGFVQAGHPYRGYRRFDCGQLQIPGRAHNRSARGSRGRIGSPLRGEFQLSRRPAIAPAGSTGRS